MAIVRERVKSICAVNDDSDIINKQLKIRMKNSKKKMNNSDVNSMSSVLTPQTKPECARKSILRNIYNKSLCWLFSSILIGWNLCMCVHFSEDHNQMKVTGTRFFACIST